jgi:hypothetical protein
MYLLNLSLAQFLVVFGSISALSIALYLLDRARRRQVVSTLRFWVAAEQPPVAARRRHINQPWSLILQLASMGLILLAIGQMRFGSPEAQPRDHVIILDTSAWMGAKSGNRTLMQIAIERARQYLRAVPARDRVMLVRADALTTPVTAFEPDRRKVETAILSSTPGATALNLDQAFAFARRLQQRGGRIGEIAFIGTGHVAEREPGAGGAPIRNLRVIPIADPVQNSGLRKVGARRSTDDSDLWEIYASVKNYGPQARRVHVAAEFGLPGVNTARAPIGAQTLPLEPGAEAEASFRYRTKAAGVVAVELHPHDGFDADDRAELELPAQPSLIVTVYSAEPDLLRPVFAASPRVAAVYRRPAEYRADDKGLVILDRFVPPQRPAADSIWIDPPAAGSPVPVRQRVAAVPFAHWHPSHPAAEGLRAKDFRLDSASVFAPAPNDVNVGEVAAGPVIVARPSQPKVAVLGFHPALSGMRYELSTPLLFADLMRWTSPEIFRRWEIAGGSIGAVKLTLDHDSPAGVKVLQGDGRPVPFTVRDRVLHFFAGTPGTVRVVAGDREWVYSLTMPEVWEAKWDPPADIRHGVPRPGSGRAPATEMWPWLALLGAAGLVAEWLLYGRFRRAMRASVRPFELRGPSAKGDNAA